MKILISNDDGINSRGLRALAERLSLRHKVLVVAPDGNRSAFSHSLTIAKTVKLKKDESVVGYDAYSLSGTPVDCIKFAELVFNDFNADIVIAGINKGHNLGSDILYSGTVAIACEASFHGHVSFAFSAFDHEGGNEELYAEYAEKIIRFFMPISKSGDIWNVNFPSSKLGIKGIKVTPLGRHEYTDRYVKVNEEEYILKGTPLDRLDDEDCDIVWGQKGYVTVTPILFNKTNYRKIEEVKDKCERLL